MSEENDIIDADIDEPSFDTVPERAKETGVKFRTVLASSAVAALLGISGGAYFGGMAGQSTQKAPVNYSSDIDAINKSVGTLTAKLERLERQVKELDNQTPSKTAENIEIPDISALDTRLAALETALSEIPDNSDLYARLDTIEQAAFEPQSLTNLKTIEDRIEALESREPTQAAGSVSEDSSWETSLTALETDIDNRLSILESAEVVEIPKIDLKPVEKRLADLENRVQAIPITLPVFPREAVLEALENAKPDERKGWLSRALGDQVVVQDADLLARLDRIEENVARQDVVAIEQDIASLPETAQKALEPWLIQIRKTGN